MKINLETDVLSVNQKYADDNRKLFQENHVFVVNILGSPGAGKTTLLERILHLLPENIHAGVIEGDLATAKDAARIAAHGVQVIQINTDGGCHLDAQMVAKVLPVFNLEKLDLLLIENVGNLVCPSGFDLGEDQRLVVLSIAEGGDKPSKYPGTFLSADMVVLNKMDLVPFIDIDLDATKKDIFDLKPEMEIFETVSRMGHEKGLEDVANRWCDLAAAKRRNA